MRKENFYLLDNYTSLSYTASFTKEKSMTLKEYMEKNELTQRVLANDLGITISHLRMLLNGGGHPSRKLAIKIELITNGKVTKEEAMFNE